MKLERALALTSGLVGFSGLLALLLTLEAPLWLVLPAMGLAAASGLYAGFHERLRVPGRALAGMAAAALGFSVLDFLYIGGSLPAAAADLMALLLCIKLVSLNEFKDYVQLYAASLFVLLASTAISTEIYFIAPFVLFFVSLAWALMLLTIKGEADAVSSRKPVFRFGAGFFGGTALLSLGAFVVTLAIFFAIPRVGIGFMSKRAGGLLRTSGFSDTVDLGSMGEVKLDPTVVMRVRLPGADRKPGTPLYWRGRTFDHYDGKRWADTSGERQGLYGGRGGRFYLRPGEQVTGEAVVQEISLEPLDTATLFALCPAYELTADLRYMRMGSAGELFLPYPSGNRIHYTVRSYPYTGSYRRDDLPDDSYLQLPDGSSRVAGLASEITGASPDAGSKADAVMDYLGSGYAYTLDPPRDRTLNPMDDFLFNSRAGFCEHFATAMTLLLRGAGVHARMVSGFMGGEWNGYGGYMLIREQDAHTWVEAYIPGTGWKVYDPTPPSAAGGSSSAALGRLGGVLDYLRYRWDRYVVYYNLRDQMVAAGWAADAYYLMKTSLSRAANGLLSGIGNMAMGGGARVSAGRALAYFAAAAATAALLVSVWFVLRGRKRRRGPDVEFYASMLRTLGKRGHTMKEGMTPMEFASALPVGPGRLRDNAVLVTWMYYRVRYGGESLTGSDMGAVASALDEISG